jgi:hypothetical protein
MSARDLPTTFCVLAVTAGYLNSRSSTTCRGSLPTVAFRSASNKAAESTTINAGLMDMFKDAMGSNPGSVSKGNWSAEEFQKMVVAIESSSKAGVEVVPNWDDLDHPFTWSGECCREI